MVDGSKQDLLIEDGHVVTYGPAGDLGRADVHIRGAEIVAIGADLERPPQARRIDARGKVVLPGLIDTHRHVWQAAIAGTGAKVSLSGYLGSVIGRFAKHYEAEDVYAGVLWGALQALNAGVTTVVDWSHITVTPAHADANIEALSAAGIRARFLYGPPLGADVAAWYANSDLRHPEDARRVREEYFPSGERGRLTMGLALRGPGSASPEVVRHDFGLAEELGLQASIHCGQAGNAGKHRTVDALDEMGLLGPDINYAHANQLTEQEFEKIAASGGSISPCPSVDLLMALGSYPATGRAQQHGIRCGLSVDTVSAAGTDLFTEMRIALAAERSRANAEAVARDEAVAEVAHDHRDMLALTTLEAARCWRMEDSIGSLEPGKRADLILIDMQAPSLHPFVDPVTTIVLNAGAADVDTVIVDGEIVKEGGQLVGPQVVRARALIEESQSRLFSRAANDLA